MSSDAVPGRTPDSGPEPGDSAESYRQRAVLLADLGRYDEAAEELAAGLTVAPGGGALLTTLARVHLAADQPVEALAVADRAVAAAPGDLGPLVARAMALTDVQRYAEAAKIGSDVLRAWPLDPYAQRTGAAILSETRNGQHALNAAWRAVAVAPRDAEAHLVLAVVAARLRLFDLAQRAYAEALELDPGIEAAPSDVGVLRLERRRWARALEELADGADLPTPVEPAPPPQVSRPAGPVLGDEPQADVAAAVRMIRYAAGLTIVAGAITAAMALASPGVSRAWAAVVGVIGIVVLGAWVARRPPGVLGRLWTAHRRTALATYASLAAAPALIVYTAVGGPWPLVAAMALAAAAELIVVTRRG